MLFGVYCNKPELVVKYETTLADYPEKFHKIVFGAIHNIAVKNSVGTITVLDIENEISVSKSALDVWNVNRGSEYICEAIVLGVARCRKIHLNSIQVTARPIQAGRDTLFNIFGWHVFECDAIPRYFDQNFTRFIVLFPITQYSALPAGKHQIREVGVTDPFFYFHGIANFVCLHFFSLLS